MMIKLPVNSDHIERFGVKLQTTSTQSLRSPSCCIIHLNLHNNADLDPRAANTKRHLSTRFL